jgi:hypothetical protein
MNVRVFNNFPLIVIDCATNTYSRYLGRHSRGRWQANQPLVPFEVEMLRTDPEAYFGVAPDAEASAS